PSTPGHLNWQTTTPLGLYHTSPAHGQTGTFDPGPGGHAQDPRLMSGAQPAGVPQSPSLSQQQMFRGKPAHQRNVSAGAISSSFLQQQQLGAGRAPIGSSPVQSVNTGAGSTNTSLATSPVLHQSQPVSQQDAGIRQQQLQESPS